MTRYVIAINLNHITSNPKPIAVNTILSLIYLAFLYRRNTSQIHRYRLRTYDRRDVLHSSLYVNQLLRISHGLLTMHVLSNANNEYRMFQFAGRNDDLRNHDLTFLISEIDARLETPSIAYRSMSSESAILTNINA